MVSTTAVLSRQSKPEERDSRTNVSPAERALSVFAGGVLAAQGLKRRGSSGALATLLGVALLHRGATGHCAVYGALGMNTARGSGSADTLPERRSFHLRQSYTIQRPAADLYAFWRKLDNLPSFMEHLESVTVLSDTRSRWVAAGPAGINAEWEAVIDEDVPNERLAWRSVGGSRVANAGSIRFRELGHDRGTVVDVELEYAPPAGALGATIATLFRENPDHQVKDDLRRFKQLMETGEIPTTEGQTSGRREPEETAS